MAVVNPARRGAACHEDVCLVAALERIGARFAWSARSGSGGYMLAVVAAAA